MIVKIQGTITSALQKRSGVSQAGNAWAVQEFVVTDEQNNTLCFEAFGEENIQKFSVNQHVDIPCILNSREYNGRYFTSLRFLAPKSDANQPSVQHSTQQAQAAAPTTQTTPTQGFQPQTNTDSLPF